MKIPTSKEVRKFLRTHRTYWERLDITDAECEKYFNISEVPTRLKIKIYDVYTAGLQYLLDELEAMDIFDYDLALYNIKKMGFCIPIRVRNTGWKEPLTVDDLEDYLKKLYDRWDLISNNALDKLKHLKKTKQKKLQDFNKKQMEENE